MNEIPLPIKPRIAARWCRDVDWSYQTSLPASHIQTPASSLRHRPLENIVSFSHVLLPNRGVILQMWMNLKTHPAVSSLTEAAPRLASRSRNRP